MAERDTDTVASTLPTNGEKSANVLSGPVQAQQEVALDFCPTCMSRLFTHHGKRLASGTLRRYRRCVFVDEHGVPCTYADTVDVVLLIVRRSTDAPDPD